MGVWVKHGILAEFRCAKSMRRITLSTIVFYAQRNSAGIPCFTHTLVMVEKAAYEFLLD